MQSIARFSFVTIALALAACGAQPRDHRGTKDASLSADDTPPDTSVSNTPDAPSCPEIYGPVCGANGETFPNDCFADVAGVAIACAGECPCAVEENPGEEAPPASCPEIYGPVCGANGETFANDCFADMASVAIACAGECPCAVEEQPAEEPPTSCPEIWGPVCGADATTYANDCFAQMASVAIACVGECPCDAGERCPSEWRNDSYCDLCLGDDPDCADCPADWWDDGVYCDTCFYDDPDCT